MINYNKGIYKEYISMRKNNDLDRDAHILYAEMPDDELKALIK